MNKTSCPFCSKKISTSVVKKHSTPCKILHDNKHRIIEHYLCKKSILEIGKIFKVDTRLISIFLKTNGIKVKSDEFGRYKNHDNIDESFLSNIDSPVKAWLIGLFAADGNVSSNKRSVSISQSGEPGYDLIQYIKELLKITNPIYTGKTIGRDVHTIRANSKIVAEQLSKYNIVPNKSLIYTFPENLMPEFYKSFIRGYLEGDGSVGVYMNIKGFKCLKVSFVGTPKFIKRCNELVPIKGTFSKCSGSDEVLELKWHGRKAIKFCDWLFSDECLYLSYKFQNYKSHKDWLEKNPRQYMKYEKDKKDALLLLLNGYNCMEIGKILNLPFQTIYRWKKK